MADRQPASTQRKVIIRWTRGMGLFELILELDQDIGSIPPEKFGVETSRSVSKGIKKLQDETNLSVRDFDYCVWIPEKDRYGRIKKEDILPNVLKGKEVFWKNVNIRGKWIYGEWQAESEDGSCSVEGDVSEWVEFDDLEEEQDEFLTSRELTREAARIVYVYSPRYKESATDFFWDTLIPRSQYDRPRDLSLLEQHVFMVCNEKVEHEMRRLVRENGIEDMYDTILELGWESMDRFSDELGAYDWYFDFGRDLVQKIDEMLSTNSENYGCLDAKMVEYYAKWMGELMDDDAFWNRGPPSECFRSFREEDDVVVSKRLDNGGLGIGRRVLQHVDGSNIAKQGIVREDEENKRPRAMLRVQKEVSRSGRRRKMTEKMAALVDNGCLA